MVSRKFRADTERDTPAIFGAAPAGVLDRRVLIVDETRDSGDTMRLAVGSIINAGASEVRKFRQRNVGG